MTTTTLLFLGVLCLVGVSTSTDSVLLSSVENRFENPIADVRQIPGTDWDYNSNGPPTWPGKFPLSCAGSLQSPLNLKESSATVRACPPLTFTNYDKPNVAMTLKNVGGVSATATLNVGPSPRMAGGCLPGTFQLEKVMWHWGATRKQGSEHMINDRSFAMEMQLVHFNVAYSRYEDALHNDDGVLIIAVVYKEYGSSEHPEYDIIAGALRSIKSSNAMIHFSIPGFLSSLMPVNTNQYYMYKGSTTHPRCEKGVTWIVFRQYGKLTHDQVQPFRELRTMYGTNLVNNYRPVQLQNNRPIYKIGF